jgi:N-acetylglucosaminyldiphosphoundecaprenol N-acetyl-beta-D-mannosaminyltransferase
VASGVFEIATNHKIFVHGVPVHCCLVKDVLEEMEKNIRNSREKRYICITNTESMYFARRVPSHLYYIKNAYFSLCDGIGVVIAARAGGKRVWRLNGPTLMEFCCEYGASRGWRHFFCGGKEGVTDLLSKKLEERFPGMVTAGVYCPPFREMSPDEEEQMINIINTAKPDILWVGLGLLKQERWIANRIDRLQVPWMVGVGAAFDFLSGIVRRAPKRIRNMGIEWLYRLCFEPRMFIRNVRSYVFMFEALAVEFSYRLKSH